MKRRYNPEPRDFIKSGYDGSWWGVYSYDRPRKFYGHAENLPARAGRNNYEARAAIAKAKGGQP